MTANPKFPIALRDTAVLGVGVKIALAFKSRPELISDHVDRLTGKVIAIQATKASPSTEVVCKVGFGDEAWVPVPDYKPALRNYLKITDAWRAKGGKVVNVYMSYSEGKGPMGCMEDFVPDAGTALKTGSPPTELYEGIDHPDNITIVKTAFSGVHGSNLSQQLKEHGIKTVIVGGLTTPICVQTTVDALSMEGFKVVLLTDACASQSLGGLSAQDCHKAAIARMGTMFAQPISTEACLRNIKAM